MTVIKLLSFLLLSAYGSGPHQAIPARPSPSATITEGMERLPALDPDKRAQADNIIRDFKSSDFSKREQASRDLMNLIKKNVAEYAPYLATRLNDPDPEVGGRLKGILRKLPTHPSKEGVYFQFCEGVVGREKGQSYFVYYIPSLKYPGSHILYIFPAQPGPPIDVSFVKQHPPRVTHATLRMEVPTKTGERIVAGVHKLSELQETPYLALTKATAMNDFAENFFNSGKILCPIPKPKN